MIAPPSLTPKVVVIVLTWNGREDTLECLRSLQAVEYPNWEVLVVDNGSEDGTVDIIRETYPSVKVVETGTNLGFTGGNNVGIEVALKRGAEFICLLNNDTVVAPDLLPAFVRAAQEYPDAGVFGAKIYFFSDPQRLWYAGADWDSNTELSFQSQGLGMLDNGPQFQQVREIVYANGCAMFFRASIVRTIGLLDERFFILYEEIDWCFRARQAGFRCLFIPEAKVWHRVSTTFGGIRSLVYEYFDLRNQLLWAERHLPLRGRVVLWAHTVGLLCPLWAGSGHALWEVLYGRRSLKRAYWDTLAHAREWWSHRRKPSVRMMRRVQWRAVCDYMVRRFGNCPPSIRAAAAKAKSLETT
jgi:GT2 family glycosyltransferase